MRLFVAWEDCKNTLITRRAKGSKSILRLIYKEKSTGIRPGFFAAGGVDFAEKEEENNDEKSGQGGV